MSSPLSKEKAVSDSDWSGITEMSSPLCKEKAVSESDWSVFLLAQSLLGLPPSPTWTRSPRTQWTCPGTNPPTMAAANWQDTSWRRRRRGMTTGRSAHKFPLQPPMSPWRDWWRERNTSSVCGRRTPLALGSPANPASQLWPLTSPVSCPWFLVLLLSVSVLCGSV